MSNHRWLPCGLLLVPLLAGCSQAPNVIEEAPPNIPTSFERLPQILESIRSGSGMAVYLGLPSVFWEPALRERELREKPTIERAGYRLYDMPLQLPDEDRARLTALFGSTASFAPHRGGKPCGGFNPDYCVEWSSDGETTTALISVECGEVKFHSSKGELYCDFSPSASATAKAALERRAE